MTKILKKSLACLLAFVLCFTAIAGCLAVSAEAPALECNFVMYAQRPSNNDYPVGGVCVGERLRAHIDIRNIVEGVYCGIFLEMPKGVDPDGIAVQITGTSLVEVPDSRYYDSEENLLTLVAKGVSSGSASVLVRYYVTEDMPKGTVLKLNCDIEAATSSATGDENIYKYHSVDRPIEVIDHEVVTDAAVAAGCETTGLTEGSHCSLCEDVLVAQTEIAPTGHAYDDGVVNPEPTCNNAGTKTYTCKNEGCGNSYTEVVDATGHTEVDVEAVAPTCTKTGLTAGKKCSVCGAFTVPQEEVAALGHNYVDGTCDVCGEEDPNAVVPCAHANKAFVSANPAVNGGPIGSITFKCDDCGETLDPEDVTYLVQSSLTTAAVECNAQTKFFLRTSATLYANSTEGILVITRKFANGVAPQTIVLTVDDAIAPDADDSNYRWLFGVGTVNFCDEFVTQLYTKRNGTWVSGLERTYSVKAAAESVINGSADPKTKKIAANLLKMGEETQKAFGIAVDKLPTAGLDDTGLGYITNTVPSIVKDVTTNFISAPSSFVQDKKAAIAQPKIAMQDSLTMTFNTSFAYYEGPKDDVKVKYTYIAANGVEVNNYLVGSWTNANVCAFELAIPAPNLRCPVTMQIFNGDVAISDTVTYSVEGILAHVLSTNPQYQAAMNAILNYSDSTR